MQQPVGHVTIGSSQEVGGTDDAVARSELQRGYITFLSTLVSSAGMDGVLTSDRNKPQLDSILQSVVYYAENGDPPCQRASFGILGRMVSVWGGGEAGKTNGTVASSAPPDFTSWIYETLVPLAFTVPASPSFAERRWRGASRGSTDSKPSGCVFEHGWGNTWMAATATSAPSLGSALHASPRFPLGSVDNSWRTWGGFLFARTERHAIMGSMDLARGRYGLGWGASSALIPRISRDDILLHQLCLLQFGRWG